MASTDLGLSQIHPAWRGEGIGIEDPLAETVGAGGQAPQRSVSLRHALAEARDLLAHARRDGAFKGSLPRILQLIAGHPAAEDLQVTAARLLAEDQDPRALAAWAGIHTRFPQSPEAIRMYLRALARDRGPAAAAAEFRRRFPDPGAVAGEDPLLALGFGYEELNLKGEAERVFQRATREFPRSRTAWRRLIHLQEARGGLLSARHSAAAAVTAGGAEVFGPLHTDLTRKITLLERYGRVVDEEKKPVSLKALDAALQEAVRRRLPTPGASPRRLGSVLMVTGSLGSGGAERQLINTVVALEQAVLRDTSIHGYEVLGPVTVACRSLSARQDNDFFLAALKEARVPVVEYGRLPPFGGDHRRSRVAALKPVIDLLPERIREGVACLVEFIRYEAPDVVHLWQDGMVYAAGLAALLADPPQIMISVRTLPPVDRVNRWRAELEPIYRAMLASPRVMLTANSTLAARRYEEWLGMPRGIVPVIHNGVVPLPDVGSIADETMWRAFEARTRGASFTLGAVMRLDDNKRPLEWLQVAERLHACHPGARFVVVGEGPLANRCREYAARLGLGPRVLFTGRSSSVGYWLARLDALMLLSRFEGMPNALIEAQMAGAPVVTTPAGGAAETVLEGRTGFVLKSADILDMDEAVGHLRRLAEMSGEQRREMGTAAARWAERAFSVSTMLSKTVDLFMCRHDEPMLAAAAPHRVASGLAF